MSERHSRRVFLRRSAALATGLAALPLLSDPTRPHVVSAHDVKENAARASELYAAMQKNFYLADSKLYLETSPRARSRPYAYLWPFYEALAGTIDLYGLGVISSSDLENRLAGLAAYWNASQQAYDSYPVADGGGDRYNDDNAWIGRAMVQLNLMGYAGTLPSSQPAATPLDRAKGLFAFIQTSWAEGPGGVYWIQKTDPPSSVPGALDRGTGPTGGFAKLALHLANDTDSPYFFPGQKAYTWVDVDSKLKNGALYYDKILGSGGVDTRYWSYNQGVMIGADVLLYRLTRDATTYLSRAIATANAAIAHFDQVGWYSQPVIFNSLFFRNLLLLYAVRPEEPFLKAAQNFADGVWNNPRIHNMRTHMIKFEERTGAYKLREQAGMVQLFACLAWVGKRDLSELA